MQRERWISILMTAAVLLPSSSAWSAEHRTFCFSPAYAAWRSFPAPNTDDGVIDPPDEKGWAPAFKYIFGNGTPDPDVVLYGYSDNKSLVEMGITVRNDKTYDDTDTILILLDYGGDHNPRYGQMIIHPLQQDIANQSGLVTTPGYAKYNVTNNPDDPTAGAKWGPSGQGTLPWLKVGRKTTPDGECSSASPGNHCRWDVELKIDQSVAGAPPIMGVNAIFVDVLRADRSSASAKTIEFTWPQDPANPAKHYTYEIFENFNPTENINLSGTPPTSVWGPTVVNSAAGCNGVWFRGMGAAISDITSSGGNTFNLNQQVTLSAHIHNSSVDGTTGNGVPAKAVSATFYHAPFGMTGFQNFIKTPPVAGSANPKNSTDPLDIAYDGATDLSTLAIGTELKVDWKPTTECNPANPTMPCDTGHQCMLVILNSNETNTSFVNQAEFQNMWINSASRFDGSARLDVKGLPLPQGATKQRIRLAATKATQYAFADGSIGIPAGALTAQLKWVFHGARFTGRHITIKGIKHEVWAPVASYGYIVQHRLPPDVQQRFEERRADLIERIRGQSDKASPRVIKALNHVLMSDPERPSLGTWRLTVPKLPGAIFVPKTNEQVMELDMAPDGALAVATTVVYDESGGGGSPSGGCCPGPSGGTTTPAKVSTLGLPLLVGAVVFRRRRRRR